MAADAITVAQLTKTFGVKKALNAVSFAVPSGSIFGFLGPNGAGKTTTIRCLMDFLRPTSGTATILSRDAQADSTELKRRIGFLSSDAQVNPHWTGNEHIHLAEAIKGKGRDTARLIKLLGFNPHVKVKSLSSGNKQKLSIILAFTGNPDLLIMDEPARGLDPMLQNILNELLRDFARSGRTVFFSSHDLNEVQGLCDEVAFIKEGKIIANKSMFDIRAMNIHIISATGKHPFDIAGLRKHGAHIVSSKTHEVTLKIQGDFNGVLRTLAKNELTDLDMTHANLEDIFMEHYKGEQE